MTKTSSYELSRSLEYPVLLVEEDRHHSFTGYNIVYRPTGFTTFGRVPNAQKFGKGLMFDSSGKIYQYEGSSGYPRFSPRACSILDNLILPGLLIRALHVFWYFGPRLIRSEHVDVPEFKLQASSAIEAYEDEEIPQLRGILSRKANYKSVIEGVDWWRYNGGNRDDDGHPVE